MFASSSSVTGSMLKTANAYLYAFLLCDEKSAIIISGIKWGLVSCGVRAFISITTLYADKTDWDDPDR